MSKRLTLIAVALGITAGIAYAQCVFRRNVTAVSDG
jgi:hypothetical protein